MKGAVVFASVNGAISWQSFESRHWLSKACFYSSIVLAIASMVTGAQQTLLLDSLAPGQRYRARDWTFWGSRGPSCKLMFAWQMPLLFLNYSMLLFLAGLSAWVISPMAKNLKYDAEAKVRRLRGFQTYADIDRFPPFIWSFSVYRQSSS